MTKTPRFKYLIDSYKKTLTEDALTPNLTGATTNPSATPTSQQNPNQNKPFDAEKTKNLLDSYKKSALIRKSQGQNQSANPNVPQTPVPGQGPTNAEIPQDQDYDTIRKSLYDHFVNELGLSDEDIMEIYKK